MCGKDMAQGRQDAWRPRHTPFFLPTPALAKPRAQGFTKATGAKDKELFTIDGATHIETYWVPKYVAAAIGKLKPFFARTL
jgi:fermentation-respiration switch protein FrsA (DUF1100 family)